MKLEKRMSYQSKYQICTKCVMDTSDRRIVFDEKGVCDQAVDFYENIEPNWDTGKKGREEIELIANKIKKEGKGKEYDSILGVSGGADSSYMLHLAVKELGLRPLVFHVDCGWNSDLAVSNINSMIEALKLDLFTEVIDWEEMRNFQLALLESGVPHIDIPQDHASLTTLYYYAEKYNIKYILNGGNISTEVVRNPLEYFYHGTDMIHINYILKNFCKSKLKTYPFSPIFRHRIYLRYIKRIKVIKPLNYFPYIKEDAMKFLSDNYNWRPYPQKHFESNFTKFFEGYWLPKRFGFDPRRVQFSSLILTGQLSRDEALKKLENDVYTPEELKLDKDYITKKLDINHEDLERYFNLPKKFYWDYPNNEKIFRWGSKVLKKFGIEKSIKR